MKKSFLLFRNIGLKHLAVTAGLNLVFITGMYATTGDNLITGGSMDNASDWNVTVVGSGATFDSTETAIWNYTLDGPSAGSGGCLYLSDTITGSMTSQYCIWQAVNLEGGKTYKFDAAFKSDTSQQAWSEVYIGTIPPNHGSDVTVALGWTLLQNFNSWAGCNVDAGYDGTYDAKGCGTGKFQCTTTGTYYFIIKTGNTTWDATVAPFAYMIDNVSLVELPILIGGNMENKSDWNVSYLGAKDTTHSTWDYTGDVPAAGSGGCLRITDTTGSVNQTQYCIWQPVQLDSTKLYVFDGAIKSKLKNPMNFWIQVYIGTSAPTDTADLSSAFKQIVEFNSYDNCKADSGLDGTFVMNGCKRIAYQSATNKTLYFALKAGTNQNEHFEFLFDNLSLYLDTVKPTVTITSTATDTVHGKFPIKVTFSKGVTGFTEGELNISNGTSQGGAFTSVAGGVTYTDTIVPTAEGAVIIGIPAAAGQDNNGNKSIVAKSLSLIYTKAVSSVSNTLAGSISIYPNPVNGVLNFSIPSLSGVAEVSIINMVGSTIYSNTLATTSGTIDMSAVKSGAYIMRIQTNNQTYIQKIIVK